MRLLVTIALGTACTARAAPAAEVTLELAPVCVDGADVPSQLAVALSLPAKPGLVFLLDDEVFGATGMAALIGEATARDARGALPIVRRLRDHRLELAPGRPPIGTVTLQYRARSVPATDTGAEDGLRHDATGIGGHGGHFLALPDSARRYRIRIAWGAPQCPATTRGTGMNTEPSELVGELSTLFAAVFYWGTPQRTQHDDGARHLRTAWFGAPAFDVAAAGAWAAQVFDAERAFFADTDPAPYSIFVRVLQSHGDRANGTGQESSYLSWIGPRTAFARRLKVNIAHEMLHRWLGLRLRLAGPEGTAYWFTEGFTVHYSNVIAFRAGLLTVDEFLESLNDIATRHAGNARAGASNAEIARDFNRDHTLATVPYTRGALYAVELDAALRRASRGTLAEAVLALYRESRVHALPADAVRRLVQAKLGAAGVARYDAVIVGGGTPQPPADAYGPCFTRAGALWTRVPSTTDAQCRAW